MQYQGKHYQSWQEKPKSKARNAVNAELGISLDHMRKDSGAKFAKLDALDKLGPEGRKAKRKMNDSWTKRVSRNPGDLWNPNGKRLAR